MSNGPVRRAQSLLEQTSLARLAALPPLPDALQVPHTPAPHYSFDDAARPNETTGREAMSKSEMVLHRLLAAHAADATSSNRDGANGGCGRVDGGVGGGDGDGVGDGDLGAGGGSSGRSDGGDNADGCGSSSNDWRSTISARGDEDVGVAEAEAAGAAAGAAAPVAPAEAMVTTAAAAQVALPRLLLKRKRPLRPRHAGL